MKRLLLILALAVIIALAASWVIERTEPEAAPPVVAQMRTRSAAAPVNLEWEAQLARLKEERTMPMLLGVWLQAPIRVDGSIPLWGVVSMLIGVVVFAVGVVVLMQKQAAVLAAEVKAHNELDTMRFDTVTDRFDAMTKQIENSHKEVIQALKVLD